MKLPNSKNVSIPKEKLTKYVLSETHSVGKFKAKFFRKLGFNETNVNSFEESLRAIAPKEVKEEISTAYGTKYLIDGEIKTPSGKVIKVRTVWILEGGQKKPRFITVYPV